MAGDSFIERSRSVKEDACRWTLMIPKIILQGLSLWPVQTTSAKILRTCHFLNIGFILVSHTAYFIENIRSIVKMAELLTTVNVALQAFVRIATMLYYKDEIRNIMSKVCTEFWPSSVLEPSENRKMRKLTVRHFIFVTIYGLCATCTTVQFMYQPLILGIRNLPLMLKLPFDYMGSPAFELVYVWNACTCITIDSSIMGFDFLFTMLTWNCAMQFKMIRLLLGRLAVDSHPTLEDQSAEAIAKKYKEETQKLVRYIEHHEKLLGICDVMETMFRYIMLIQLLNSAVGLCVCSFAAVSVSSLFAKMMTFSVFYLMQLFLYCAFGNELHYQSTTLAYAAFRCGWHYSGNKEIRKSIIMLMQKSQKGQCLTARGFAVVNYSSCLQVIRIAFSFYTVLDRMKQKLV